MPEEKGITMTPSQQQAFDKMVAFACRHEPGAFILRGYAGTGKTTLMRTLIAALDEADERFVLLASTGRAAKVLSNATGSGACTVHSLIYKFTELNQDLEAMAKVREEKKEDASGALLLNFELARLIEAEQGQLYIVDESSMLSDSSDGLGSQATFGSGRLLSDFLSFDPRGRFLFIGDECQLPPVSQKRSPALSVEYLTEVCGMKRVEEAWLKEIVRQANDNDIVVAAEKVRRLYANPPAGTWAKFPLGGFGRIHLLTNEMELVTKYLDDIKANGLNAATLLCHSNKQCNQITRMLRPALGMKHGILCEGDLLLVTQNNISGLVNGDLVVVQSIGGTEYRAGLTFVDVTVEEVFTKNTYKQLLIMDVLLGYGTNLTPDQHKRLFIDYHNRMKERGIGQKSPLFRDGMLDDSYLNALRAVFGYALTCHKAQGGDWERVYLDIPRYFPAQEKPFVYQWVYTAITRARSDLYTVRDFWIESGNGGGHQMWAAVT